jgi:hypothetical protein
MIRRLLGAVFIQTDSEPKKDSIMPNFNIGYGVIKPRDCFRDGKFDACEVVILMAPPG